MQNLSAGGSVVKIFPCTICSLETNSVYELHNHQKYYHTTEELSLSLICLVHYMCFKDEALGLDVASRWPLLLKNHAANYHFCQLHNQGNSNSSNDCAILNPGQYGSGKTKKTETLSGKNRKAKALEQENHALPYSLISAGDFRESSHLMSAHFNTIFLTSWEIELGKVPEISDETFLKCVDGICKDLQVLTKRQVFWNSTNRTNHGRNGKGRRTTSSRNFVPSARGMRTKGLQRSQTCTKSPVSDQLNENVANKCKEAMPIDYSTSLPSYSQEVDQASFHKEIPVLEKALGDSKDEQQLRDMPVLEPYLRFDGLLQQ